MTGRVHDLRWNSDSSPCHHSSSGRGLVEQIACAENRVYSTALGEVENPPHHFEASPRQSFLLLGCHRGESQAEVPVGSVQYLECHVRSVAPVHIGRFMR